MTAYTTPWSRSDPRLRIDRQTALSLADSFAIGSMKCDVCGCQIPDNVASWAEHVNGIRHRRLSLSHLHGGHLIVSIFEDDDRLKHIKSASSSGHVSPEKHMKELRVILAQLLPITTTGNLYQRALAAANKNHPSIPVALETSITALNRIELNH